MGEFLRKLFDTADFPPRWQCGSWSELLGWVHVVSDIAIWLAYMGIPIAIFLVVYRKRDVPFPRLFWLFGGFIAFCGIGHLLEATIFWWPAYRLAGLVKLLTAAISIATLVAAVFALRRLIRMPSAQKLMADLQYERSQSSRRIEELFRSAFESAPAGMMLIGESGIILLANSYACRLFGWESDELVGRRIEDLVPHAMRDRHVQLRNDYFADPSKRPMAAGRDLTAVRRDGSEVQVEILLSPVDLAEGKAVISTIVDVTPRKAVEAERQRHAAELERRNQALDEFTYLVSHDLKAPLRAISLVSAWLQDDLGDKVGDEGAAHLQTLRERAMRMDELIQGALAYARSGREHGELATIDCSEVLQEVLLMLDPNDAAAVTVTAPLPELVYERNHLINVFLNLIGNALVHGNRENHGVVVSCTANDDGYTFSVSDNGPGIAPEHHERIFQMFQRLPETGVESTGVGLAIVKTLVERHGGRVWVESELGKGTTMHFTVPVLSNTAAAAAVEGTVA